MNAEDTESDCCLFTCLLLVTSVKGGIDIAFAAAAFLAGLAGLALVL